jgi:hypothetical protein
MTETLAQAPLTATPSDPTTGFRRAVAAIALPLAFVLQLACNTIYAVVSTSSGMSDTAGTAEMMQLYAAFPSQVLACTLLALVGCLLAVLGLPAALRVVRPARPRLGMWAVALMIAGYVCYFGVSFTNFDTLALATGHVDAAAALDASVAGSWGMAFFVLFIAGNLGGTLLLGLAVILGGRRVGVPWWSGLLIMSWTVGHLVNIAGGGEWFAVAGGALEVIGLSIVATAALRTSNAEWRSRG